MSKERCRECGRPLTEDMRRRRLDSNVFSFTATSALIFAIMICSAEWNLAWWKDRVQITLVMMVPVGIAAYFWWKKLTLEKKP